MESNEQKLDKNGQIQTLINISMALDSLRIYGSDANLFVQVKQGLDIVIKNLKEESVTEGE
jgi:hypothetical protein